MSDLGDDVNVAGHGVHQQALPSNESPPLPLGYFEAPCVYCWDKTLYLITDSVGIAKLLTRYANSAIRAHESDVRRENDALRGIAAKVMPCHYCGAKAISECPHGFPGCALGDDLIGAEASATAALRKERQNSKKLQEDAARYRWLKATEPAMLCHIAWRVPAATGGEWANDPDKAIDKAINATKEK